MSYSEYQKIRLHSTSNLAKDQEIIDYEKDAVQRIMMEYQIKFSIEIEEKNLHFFLTKYIFCDIISWLQH